MTPKEIDHIIDSLPESDYSALSDAALNHWSFRVQNYAIPLAAFLIYFFLCFLAVKTIPRLWPHSLIAATIAAVCLFAVLWFLINAASSLRVTEWRVRSALRRHFKSRGGVGAP